MGRNVIHIIIATLLIACFSLSARAGGRHAAATDSLGGPALRYLTAPSAEWVGDSLVLRFSCTVEGRLRGAVSLHAVPFFMAVGDTLSYPVESFYSHSGAKFLRRRQTLSDGSKVSRERDILPPRLHVVGRRRADSVLYRAAIAVPTSLTGSVRVTQVVEDCCKEYLLAGRDVTVAVPERRTKTSYADRQVGVEELPVGVEELPTETVELPTGPLPLPVEEKKVPLFSGNVTFIEPVNEPVKRRSAAAAVRLNYPVDRWEVYPDFGNNASELRRVDSLLSPVAHNTDAYKLSKITITGYASPEGTYTHNLELSGNRATGMRSYLMKRYNLPSSLSVVTNGVGEDWEGLRSAVAESDMAEKAEVLSIIDGYGIFDGRELRLMDMRGGRTYGYMLRELFPPLRRVEIRMDYVVRSFNLAEADSLIDVRSRDLSLHEIYKVARSRNDDETIVRRRDSYGREYDIAVRYFPDDAVANINAASAALVRGDLKTAAACLERVKENPLARNNMGVYCWLCGKTAEAKAWFLKARELGSREATRNLEQIARWEAEFGKGKGGGEEDYAE